MKNKIENVIYILTNPQYPGYVKIGYASDLKSRVSSLNTGALVEFTPYAVYETPLQNGDVEVHRIVGLLNPNLRASKFYDKRAKLKEFFKMEPEEVYRLLKCIATVSGTLDKLYKIDSDYNKIYETPSKKEKPADVPANKTETASLTLGDIPDGVYYMRKKVKEPNQNLFATMVAKDEKFTLKKGSTISKTYKNRLSAVLISARKAANIVEDVLQEDIEFGTPSGASAFVVGRNDNGWTSWKTKEGKTIDEIVRKQKAKKEKK